MPAWIIVLAILVIVGGCSDGEGGREEIAAERMGISVDRTHGTFGFWWDGLPEIRIENACSRVYLDTGWIGPENYKDPPQVHMNEDYSGTRILSIRFAGDISDDVSHDASHEVSLEEGLEGSLPDLITEIRLAPGESFATVKTYVENRTTGLFRVHGLEPVSCRLASQSLIHVGADPAQDVVLINGHTSWSYSGIVRVRSGPLNKDRTGRVFTDQEILQMGNNVVTLPQAVEMLRYGWDELQAGLSWWMTAVHAPGSAGTLVAGALTADQWKTSILLEYNPGTVTIQNSDQGISFTQFRVLCGITGDHISLGPSQAIASEEVLIGAWGDGLEGLERYGEEAANRMPSRQWIKPDTEPLLGWSSWSGYFEDVSEEKVLDQAQFIKLQLAPLGYRLVQIDDGYERAWGDWRPNAKFPSGLKALCEEITGMGLIPGIWIAPFLVDETIPLVQDHPTWFLRDDQGAPIRYLVLPCSYKRPLDMTHPEARAFVFQNLRDLKEAGFKFFKVDFLFGASYEGQHYLAEETGLATLRSALKLIREAVGEDSWVLVVEAPWLAGAAVGDYYRQSFDVVYSFFGPAWPFFEAEARGTVVRYFSHNRLFRSDPDHVLVRPPIPLEEARAVVSYAALTGGLWLLGDVLSELSPERLAMVKDPGILTLLESQEAARPLDLFDHPDPFPYLEPTITLLAEEFHIPRWSDAQVPRIWSRPDNGGGSTVGIFNWEDETQWGPWTFPQLGLDPHIHYRVEDVWSGQTWETTTDYLAFELPARNVRLLKFQPLAHVP